MWQFLTLVTTLISPIAFIRALKTRLHNLPVQTPRPWAIRPPLPEPHFTTPLALEDDIWAHKREALSKDHWESMRPEINSMRLKTNVQAHPARRQYILEDLDGGESDDYPTSHPRRRGKRSRNARAR